MILVVSHPRDDHAAGVLAALERAGHPAVLLDTARFPRSTRLTRRFGGRSPGFALSDEDLELNLEERCVAWWRRPQPFTLDPDLASDASSFAYSECHEAVAGLWSALELNWVNPPPLDEAAHHKPYQLKVAHDVGFPSRGP